MELKTDVNIPYVDTEDAFEIFQTVVQNGQTRLALEVLVDIMAVAIDKINELDEIVKEIVSFLSDDSEQESTEEKQQEQTKTVEQKEVIVEEKQLEKEEPVKQEQAASKQKVKKEETEQKE
jgi:hypothetical protein